MEKTFILIFCLIIGLFARPSFATEVTVFGPNQYVRTTGAPDVFTGPFVGIPGEDRIL